MDEIIEIDSLGKVYGRGRGFDPVVAIDDLSLTIGTPGNVHGFLGPNGSGKTTTIRCLLGLIRPSSGTVRLFGSDSTKNFHEVVSRVGAIVENPKMFPSFTGRKNLQLLADIQGIPASTVEEMLGVVGLGDRGEDTFESYSLGMKQRLAIAGALLKNPDLLILDEPANGLDPAGIAEMRALIRSIAAQGKAVLVSSHQLSEIEQVCDDVTIISLGRLVVSGSLESIRHAHAGRQGVLVGVADSQNAMRVLGAAGLASTPMPGPDEFFVDTDPANAATVSKVLAENGMYVHKLAGQTATLEDIFLELTAPPAPGQMVTAAAGPPQSPGPATTPPRPPVAPPDGRPAGPSQGGTQ